MTDLRSKLDGFFKLSDDAQPVDKNTKLKARVSAKKNISRSSTSKSAKKAKPKKSVDKEIKTEVTDVQAQTPEDSPEEVMDDLKFKHERDIGKLRAENVAVKAKLKTAIKALDTAEKRIDLIQVVRDTPIDVFKIKPKTSSGESEAVACMIASDWHVEEVVDPKKVNYLNEYTPEIAAKRAEMFFQNGLRLATIMNQDIKIKTVVLALLGDFFSNNIHDELAEINELLPMNAIWFAQRLIVSGIQFILDNSDYDLIIPCHSGNHARTTKKVHISNEQGHSLEWYMYQNLADHFRDQTRVKFMISEGYLSYLTIFDTEIRIHHGHSIKYGGGVGGIYIPTNKAIAQWNKAKNVDLDIFGHFHQFRDGGNFIANGSMIGYNAYAIAIKAEYEKPKQAFFLIDKKRGKTVVAPICFV